MIKFEDFSVLWELVDRRMHSNGYIYVGTADFFEIDRLRSFEKLIELGFIVQAWAEQNVAIEPIAFYGYHEYPYLLLPLGQIALMWPDTVIEGTFPY